MPAALYLYNSQDRAAVDFYTSLKAALRTLDWDLKSDSGGAFEDAAGERSFEAISRLIGEADTVVFAVGPHGPGRFQGTFEAAEVFRARQKRSNLRILPILVGNASLEQVPLELRDLIITMENAHKGGKDLLSAVCRQITGQDWVPQKEDERRDPMSSEEVKEVCELLERRVKNGLILFVGPYAAVEVHASPTPGTLGAKLLEGIPSPWGSGDLLAHPWIAAEARRVVKPLRNQQDVWDDYCEVLREYEASAGPLSLYASIGDLARAWQDSPSPASETHWRGLLLVTTDQHNCLEEALFKQRVPFGRLRYTARGNLCYERLSGDLSTLDFAVAWQRTARQLETQGTRKSDREPTDFEEIMILKLADSRGVVSLAPLTTRDHLNFARDRSPPPRRITTHLQSAPFLMLGGGLLDPLVSLAFSAHFLPAFNDARDTDGACPPRYVAFDSKPGQLDMIQRIERYADVKRRKWVEDVFKLDRVDWPLTDLLARLTKIVKDRGTAR